MNNPGLIPVASSRRRPLFTLAALLLTLTVLSVLLLMATGPAGA